MQVLGYTIYTKILKFLSKIYPTNEFWRSEEEINNNIFFKNQEILNPNPQCPFSMPQILSEKTEMLENRNKKRKDPLEKFKSAWKKQKEGLSIEEWLSDALKVWRENLSAISVQEKEIINIFESRAKGTRRYQTQAYWRIHDYCEYLDLFKKGVYFVTLTVGKEIRNKTLYERWKAVAEELSRFTKELRKTLGAEYTAVVEAHKDGTPHIHMVIYLNDFLHDEKEHYSKKLNKKWVCAGTMYTFIQRNWTIGFSNIQLNVREGTANYLSKYIAKSADCDIKQLTKKDDWTETEKKMLLTIMLPIMTGTRGFRMSQSKLVNGQTFNNWYEENKTISPEERRQILKKLAPTEENIQRLLKAKKEKDTSVINSQNPKKDSETSEEEKLLDEALSFVDTEEWKSYSDSERSDYLIKLCTKLTFPCEKRVRLTAYSTLDKKKNGDIFAQDAFSETEKAEIFEHSCKLKCEGCIITHWLNKMRTGQDDWFDKGLLKNDYPKTDNLYPEDSAGKTRTFQDCAMLQNPKVWTFSDTTDERRKDVFGRAKNILDVAFTPWGYGQQGGNERELTPLHKEMVKTIAHLSSDKNFKSVYREQYEWNKKFVDECLALGIDMDFEHFSPHRVNLMD